MRKKRKFYVVIALLAALGLVLTSLTGAFTGIFGQQELGHPEPEWGLEEYLRYFQQQADALLKDLEDDPEDPIKLEYLADIYFEKGFLYGYLGDFEKSAIKIAQSFEVYQDALELNPDDIDLGIKTAMAAQYAGEHTVAEQIFKETQGKDPGHPNTYYVYGAFLHDTEDLEGAIQQWEAMLALEDDFDREKYPNVDPQNFVKAAELLEHVREQLEGEDEDDD